MTRYVSFLVLLAQCSSVWNAGQAQSTEINLRATVQAIAPLSTFSGTAIRVAGDPRFALVMRIESAVPAVGNLNKGTVTTFAIHSPSLLFDGEATIGKTYDFLLCRQVEHGKVTYSGLKVLRTAIRQNANRTHHLPCELQIW